MTYLTALMGLAAVAMMATLILLAIRRDRASRRNWPVPGSADNDRAEAPSARIR